MRVIARKTLKDFWEKHAGSEQVLKAWFHEAKATRWKSFTDIKSRYRSADVLPGNRVVFNLKGTTYPSSSTCTTTPASSSSASSALTPTTTASTPPPFNPTP